MAEYSSEFSPSSTYETIKAAHRRQKSAKPCGMFLLEGDTTVAAASYDVVGDKIQLLKFPDNCRLVAASVIADKEFDTGGTAVRFGLVVDQGTESTFTSPVGAAFTNQPANDGLEMVSSEAADITQSVTIYGTTQGTDTVVAETLALDGTDGTTQVATVKTDWGFILGVVVDAAPTGTITIREASGNQTVTTLTPTVLSRGITDVTAGQTAFGDQLVELVASGATTKVFGLIGTDSDGTTIYDAQALTGATKVLSNSRFQTVTQVLTGDLEATRTVTINSTNPLLVTGSQFATGLPIPLNFTGGSTPGTEIGVDVSEDALALRVEVAPTTANTGSVTFTSKALCWVGDPADIGTSN